MKNISETYTLYLGGGFTSNVNPPPRYNVNVSDNSAIWCLSDAGLAMALPCLLGQRIPNSLCTWKKRKEPLIHSEVRSKWDKLHYFIIWHLTITLMASKKAFEQQIDHLSGYSGRW